MKILEINKFHYLRRGAEKHYLDLIALLKSQGHEVAVFSMEHPQNIFSPWKKYFVSYVGYQEGDTFWQKLKGVFRIFYSFEAKAKIKKLLDDFQPDVAHIHNIYHQISPSILKEIKKRGIPIVMTIHDYNLVCPNHSFLCQGKKWSELGPGRERYFVKNKCFKNSYPKSFLALAEFRFNKLCGFYEKYVDQLIAPSQFVKDILAGEGIDPRKIVVLPHFIFKDPLVCAWPKDQEVARERYVFYSGSISQDKNVDTLITLFENIAGVKLYLAGNLENDFVLPKNEKIKYLGFLDAATIKKYVQGSLFVIAPSRLPETFGLVALEALAAGKPVICYAAGAYGEIVENDKTGFVCSNDADMQEKIERLAADEGLRVLFLRNALEKAKKFDSANYYAEFMGILTKLMNDAKLSS